MFQSKYPVGRGTLRWMMFDAYDAELWFDARDWSYDEPFALSLIYRRAFTGEELTTTIQHDIKRMQGVSDAELSIWQEAGKSGFPSVEKGDRITATYHPKYGLRFYLNSRFTYAVSSLDFSRWFFDIWLSEETPKVTLRNQLLNLPAQIAPDPSVPREH